MSNLQTTQMQHAQSRAIYGSVRYDPIVAAAARAENAAREARLQELFAEDHSIPPTWLAAVGRVLYAIGRSRLGTFLFGWMDTALVVIALHTMPVLWLVDHRFNTNKAASTRMFRSLLFEIYMGHWYEGHRMVSCVGYFRTHRMQAIAVGALSLILTSPMLIVTIPTVVASKALDRFRERVSAYKIRHNLV